MITQCCNFKTLDAFACKHAHHAVPSPTAGTTRRRNACSVIVDKLWILKADNDKDAVSV